MRRAILTAAVLGAALAVAPPAFAATEIGSSTAADQSCGGNATLLQAANSASGPSYTVPEGGGVVTSWSFNARSNPGVRRLKLLRQTESSSTYVVVGESELETGVPGRRNTFATRIGVAGGERLGFYTSTGDGCGSSGSGGFVFSASGDVRAGFVYQPSSFEFATTMLDVTAVVERDADGDGYGDETQDRCPTDKTVFATACEADLGIAMTAAPARVRLGDRITYTLAAANAGPIKAKRVVLEQTLPKGAPVVSATEGCTGFVKIECAVGDLASGAFTRTYTIVVRAPDAGDLTSTAVARSDTNDPVAANNTAAATVAVTPPRFGGVRLSRRTVRATDRSARVRVACPIAARSCTGTLALTTAKPRKLDLGVVPLRVKGGRTSGVRIRFGAAARRYLRANRRVRVVASARATDAFSQRATRKASFTMLVGSGR